MANNPNFPIANQHIPLNVQQDMRLHGIFDTDLVVFSPYKGADGKHTQIRFEGSKVYLHRALFEAMHGPAPADWEMSHSFQDVISDVNPLHGAWEPGWQNKTHNTCHTAYLMRRATGLQNFGASVVSIEQLTAIEAEAIQHVHQHMCQFLHPSNKCRFWNRNWGPIPQGYAKNEAEFFN